MRERLCEFMEERFCPCISMRLEYTPHTVVQKSAALLLMWQESLSDGVHNHQ